MTSYLTCRLNSAALVYRIHQHMSINAHGRVVLVVIDVQGGDSLLKSDSQVSETPGVEKNSDLGPEDNALSPTEAAAKQHAARIKRAQTTEKLIQKCREAGVPPVFIMEVHKPSLVDIGRELDGAEGPHCVEGWSDTELAWYIKPEPNEFVIRKRRYSAFFASELALVLKSYKAETLLLVGGLTDVCVHYTAVDAHQNDFHIRVITDAVSGSSREAHDAALKAMQYLQRDALVTSEQVFAYLDSKIEEGKTSTLA